MTTFYFGLYKINKLRSKYPDNCGSWANAFQAMNGKEGRLTLSTRSFKDRIEVNVSDNGIGIPQKYLNYIFDPFFTTKKFGAGKGLGLNIVYRIVTKYDGSIAVESKEGTGTTFTIQFPIRREQ